MMTVIDSYLTIVIRLILIGDNIKFNNLKTKGLDKTSPFMLFIYKN